MMPHQLLIVSQSDCLILIVAIKSHTEWQTLQIQISWLLQKPTDLDLHCLQRQGIMGFSRMRVNKNISKHYLQLLYPAYIKDQGQNWSPGILLGLVKSVHLDILSKYSRWLIYTISRFSGVPDRCNITAMKLQFQ